MTKEERKQRLIELIAGDVSAQEQIITNYTEAISYIADFLIANGVTIRKRGEWKDNHCTVCGETPIGEELWEHCDCDPPKFEYVMDFCPSCGAYMRGDAE